MFCGYVENPDLTSNYLFADEINVRLNVFCSLMLNQATQEIDGIDVVTLYHGGLMNRII